jgi:hypothetical protein
VRRKHLPPAATATALATFGRGGSGGGARRPPKGSRTAVVIGIAAGGSGGGGGGGAGRALFSPLTSPTLPIATPDTPGSSADVDGTDGVTRQCVLKQSGRRGPSGAARTYTSKYRGVHQTFPTRRWEAQFRRAGKPTSLGCFDREEEAARAYDKMMLWCEIHHADLRSLGLLRNGVTNFEPSLYAADMTALRAMSQDDLVSELRRMGRLQAAGGVTGRLPPPPPVALLRTAAELEGEAAAEAADEEVAE